MKHDIRQSVIWDNGGPGSLRRSMGAHPSRKEGTRGKWEVHS